MDFDDQGQNKQSAYDAGFENQDPPEGLASNETFEFTGTSFEPEPKRARYPEPSPYAPGPYNPHINFDQHAGPPLLHQSSSSSFGHLATSSPSIPYLDSSPHNNLVANNPHLYGVNSSPGSEFPHDSPARAPPHIEGGLMLPRPSPSHSSNPFASPEAPQSSPMHMRTSQRPLTRSEAARRRGPRLIGARRVGGASFEAAGLAFPANLDAVEVNRRQGELDRELQRQVDNPPILPPSDVEDVDPKPQIQKWIKLPESADDQTRETIVKQNNLIAAENQRIERHRNNQAAKKSRKKRVEALNNTREILNKKCAECDWWRMKAMTLGAKSEDWDNVPRMITDKMIRDIADRVQKIDDERAEIKKKEDILKRTKRKRGQDDDDASSRQETPASDY